MPSRSPFRIETTGEQRIVLEKRTRTHTAGYWEVVRDSATAPDRIEGTDAGEE